MLKTDRLVLREWREADLAPFSRMNGDLEVMRYFPSVQTWEESKAAMARFSDHINQHGFGFWAVELQRDSSFIGMLGMQHAHQGLPCAPAVEIGWRLHKSVWGQGLATEGAKACLRFGFKTLALNEIVSFTPEVNKPSENVMRKIGMKRDYSGDFLHPMIASTSSIAPHILYRIKRSDFIAS